MEVNHGVLSVKIQNTLTIIVYGSILRILIICWQDATEVSMKPGIPERTGILNQTFLLPNFIGFRLTTPSPFIIFMEEHRIIFQWAVLHVLFLQMVLPTTIGL